MAVALSEEQLAERLHEIFVQHPLVSYDHALGLPCIPAHALVQVFQELAQDLGRDFLSPDEQASLQAIVDTAAVDVTVEQVQLIVPHLFPDLFPPTISPLGSPVMLDGRPASRSSDDGQIVFRSRSSSPEPGQDPKRPYMGPSTPLPNSHMRSASQPGSSSASPFDARQRSTPLVSSGPSARVRRPVALVRRRRSDSNSTNSSSNRVLSDSEGHPVSPTSGTLSPHAVPTSPSGISYGSFSGIAWPTSPESGLTGASLLRSVSQPLTRHRSAMEPNFASIYEQEIDDDEHDSGAQSPVDERSYHFASLNDTPRRRTLSNPDRYDSDNDADDDALGLVHAPPSHRPSNASLAPHDRVDALAKENHELMRRLSDAERHMQNQIAEQELEFQQLESKLSEAQQELHHAKREEKELRHKERGNAAQIGLLEQEVSKLQRAIDTARLGYQTMQKQYQDQTAAAETLRNALHAKEVEVQRAAEMASVHLAEARRHAAAREAADAQAAQLEEELSIAREAMQSVLEQRSENALLRETIERMKLDLDELRANRAPSRDNSRPSTVSRTLGAELLVQLADAERRRFLESGGSLYPSSGQNVLQDLEVFELDSEPEPEPKPPKKEEVAYENVYETFITRRTRGARAPPTLSPSRFLPPKSFYAEAHAQHDPAQSSSAAAVQTDEIDTSGSEPSTSPPDPPSPLTRPETPVSRPRLQHRRSIEEDDYEDDLFDMLVAPMSPTSPQRPRLNSKSSNEHPPSYAQIFSTPNPKALVARDAIAHWHRGAPIPFAPVPGGVSHGALRAWARLKGELGVECMVIEKILAASVQRTPPATPTPTRAPTPAPTIRRRRSSISSSTPATAPSPAPRQERKKATKKKKAAREKEAKSWRFIDILRVYLARERLPRKMFYPIVVLGAWTAVVVVATPLVTHYFAVPGMPDVADRAALTALRAIAGGASEGFAGHGAPRFDAVWGVIEHLLLGSASVHLRVPT